MAGRSRVRGPCIRRPFIQQGAELLGQVNGHSVERSAAHDVDDRRERISFVRRGRARQMRPTAEDLSDQPRARAARPDLDENAHAVLVGLFDQTGKVDGSGSLGSDRRGRGLAVDLIASSPDAAKKRDSRRRDGLNVVKREVLIFDFAADRTMDGADGGDHEKRARERGDNFLDSTTRAADQRLVG